MLREAEARDQPYLTKLRLTKNVKDFSNNPFRLVEISALSRFGVERNEEDDPEGIRPQILLAVRPDALRTHPGELVEDMARVLAGRHGPL